jgi:hypothetical protein
LSGGILICSRSTIQLTQRYYLCLSSPILLISISPSSGNATRQVTRPFKIIFPFKFIFYFSLFLLFLELLMQKFLFLEFKINVKTKGPFACCPSAKARAAAHLLPAAP